VPVEPGEPVGHPPGDRAEPARPVGALEREPHPVRADPARRAGEAHAARGEHRGRVAEAVRLEVAERGLERVGDVGEVDLEVDAQLGDEVGRR
jgi:hypothetical protein